MQPRPRIPMQGGMGQGPGFIGGRNPMMGPQGPMGGRNPMMGPQGLMGGRGSMMMGGPQQMGRGGGGLLSRLLGRNPTGGMGGGNPLGGLMGGGNQAGGLLGRANSASGLMGMGQGGAGQAATGGGLLRSLTNPGGITGFLNNTQQVLRTAQTIGPMIQQYGPWVKNLPAIWKLYRGMKNSSDGTDEQGKENNTQKAVETEESSGIELKVNGTAKTKKVSAKKTTNQQSGRLQKNQDKGVSVPKLFI